MIEIWVGEQMNKKYIAVLLIAMLLVGASLMNTLGGEMGSSLAGLSDTYDTKINTFYEYAGNPQSVGEFLGLNECVVK